jgi:hypothetical protein
MADIRVSVRRSKGEPAFEGPGLDVIDEMTTQQEVPAGWVNERLETLLEEYARLEVALNEAWGDQQAAVQGVPVAEAADLQALATARRQGKNVTVKAAERAKEKAASARRDVEACRIAVTDTINDIHKVIDEDFVELAQGLEGRADGHREKALGLLEEMHGELHHLVLAERLKGWLAQPIVGRNGKLSPFVRWSRSMGDLTSAIEQIRARVNTPVAEIPRQRYAEPSAAVQQPGGSLLKPKVERQSLGAQIVEQYHADISDREALETGQEPVRAGGLPSVPHRLLPEEGALRADKATRQAQGAAMAAAMQQEAAGEALAVGDVTEGAQG